MTSDTPLLSTRGIYKSFGAVQALTNVDLDLPAGQVTALCGDNGAGKSVLIKCISGTYTPDRGQVLWEGEPVRIHSTRDASAPRDRNRLPGPGARRQPRHRPEHVSRPRAAATPGADEDSMERAAAQTLSDLRVTTVKSIRQPVASLSGGQRQSVAVAKAVMWNSRLVIMDEPTAALGVTQTAMVLQLIRRLRDRGLAVLVVSHNLNDVFAVADRMAVLHLGRMVDPGCDAAHFDRQSIVEYMDYS